MSPRRTKPRWRRRFATVLLVVFVLWFMLGLPIIFYPLGVIPKLMEYPPRLDSKPCANPATVKLNGSILFIGDLHLIHGEDSSRFSSIPRFVSTKGIRNLVIVGDLFNSPDDARRIIGFFGGEVAARIILSRLGLNSTGISVYFLKGSPAHDPAEFQLDFEGEYLRFRTLGKCARFYNGEAGVLAVHGDDVFGGFHGFIFSYVSGRPYLEAWWKEVMKVESEEWVVMAHSHTPNIDYSRRVANTGGWTDILGFGPPRGRGLLLEDGEVSLVNIKSLDRL